MFAFALLRALHTPTTLPMLAPLQTTKPETKQQRGSTTVSVTTTGVKWKNLFDGKSLVGWKRTDFSGGGEVRVEKKFHGDVAAIVVQGGSALSGFNWTGNALPKTSYEISLEAIKLDGNDFFCGLTFPVADSSASLILGGWGGSTVGISCIDSRDASENDTTQSISFEKNRWYKVKVRVTPVKIEVWVDTKQIVNQGIADRKVSLRVGEIFRSLPLGVATYQTTAGFRSLKVRSIGAKAVP
ncbi:hypothetical protein LBMAG21_06860 [Armatimonadota bacterium]|nr:hypothetical protein LBMAG21_06860 [Armatimonadota bacterium]